MTDNEIRKLIGDERWNVIQRIIERQRKIEEILERADPLVKVVRKVHKRPSTPLSKLLR